MGKKPRRRRTGSLGAGALLVQLVDRNVGLEEDPITIEELRRAGFVQDAADRAVELTPAGWTAASAIVAAEDDEGADPRSFDVVRLTPTTSSILRPFVRPVVRSWS
jgi:hypothetical protein